jgi:hypothetical protein
MTNIDQYYKNLHNETDEGIPTALGNVPGHDGFGTSDFVKLGLTMIGYVALIGLIGRGIGRVGPKFTSGVANKIAKVFPGGNFARAHRQAREALSKGIPSRGPTISETIDKLPNDVWIRQFRDRVGKRVADVQNPYLRWKARSERIAAKAGNKSQTRKLAMRAQSFLRSNTFDKIAITKGAMAVHAQDFLKRSVPFYMADRIIGGLHGSRDRPSPFNVPGTFLDYAKFTAGFYPIDAFFIGGGHMINYGIRGLGGVALQKFIGGIKPEMRADVGKGVQKFFEETIAFGAATSDALGSVTGKIGWGDVFKPSIWANFMRPSKVEQNVSHFVRTHQRRMALRKRAQRINRLAPRLYEDDITEMVGALEKTVSKAGKFSALENPVAIKDDFTKALAKQREIKPSFYYELLGVEKAKLRERTAMRLASRIQATGVMDDMSSSQIYHKFTKGMGVTTPIYRLKGTGDIFDMRQFSPKYMYNRLIQRVEKNPFGGVMTGIGNTFLRMVLPFDDVKAHSFGEGEAYLLGHLHPSRPIDTSAFKKRLGGLFAPEKGEGGLFFLGKFYHVQPKNITPVNEYMSYRLFKTGQGAYLRKVRQRHYGVPAEELDSVKEMARTRAWGTGFLGTWRKRIHDHVLRRFEIGAGFGETESVFTWASNVMSKYWKPHSVLNVLSRESRVFNKEWIAARSREGFDKTGKQKQMAVEALQVVERFIGKASINAYQAMTARPHMFGDILSKEMTIGTGPTINIMKALQDDYYLYKSLQKVNVRDAMFRRNRKVANTINSVIGRSYDDFRVITGGAGAKGFGYSGKSTISRIDEVRHFLVERSMIDEGLKMSQLNKAVQMSEMEGLGALTKREIKALELLTYKERLLKSMTRARRTDANDEALIEALNMVGEYQNKLKPLADQYIPVWSSGHMRDYTRVPSYLGTGDQASIGALHDTPFSAVSDSFLIPGSQGFSGMLRSFFPKVWKGNLEDMPDDPRYIMSRAGMMPMWLADRFTRIGELMGFAPTADHRRSAIDVGWTTLKWGTAIAGGMAIFNATDTALDTNPLFRGTMFDEGLKVAMAEQVVKGTHVYHSFKDAAGLTSMAQYMEGMMPGSIESPFASFTRAAAPPLVFSAIGSHLKGGKGAVIGMAAGSLLGAGEIGMGVVTGEGVFAGPGLMSTRTTEQFEEEFAGRREIPVRRGRFWELSRQNYQGKDIMYYRPNWFARMKSQYEFTPDGLGSKLEASVFANPPMGFNPAGAIIDPYHYERKHYLSRPYPETGGLGEELPFIGPAVSYVTSKAPNVDPFNLPFTKPTIRMHHRELTKLFNSYDTATDPRNGLNPGYSSPEFLRDYEDYFAPNDPGRGIRGISPGTASLKLPPPVSSTSLGATLGNLEYRGIIEPLGLVGFGYESAMGRLRGKGGREGLMEPEAVMESASELYSFRRRYWDLNIGGQMGLTEFWRRFIPRRPFNTEYYNKIRNRMPGWLDTQDYFINFAYGDPYTKVPEGLLRLPGTGYEAAHDVQKTFPGRASWMGFSRNEMIERMLGMTPPLDEEGFDVTARGTYLHHVVQEELARQNLLVKAEALAFDPWTNVSGHVDAIIREGRKQKIVEIKTITTEALENMTSPRAKHYSQVNFYMKATGIYNGQILYVSRDDPRVTVAFDVPFSETRYREDVAKLMQARGIAHEMREKNLGFAGEDYSQIDRLAILADVAPYSQKYKEQLKIVRLQNRMGLSSPEERARIQQILKQRRSVVQKQELYPYRFRGKVFSPDIDYVNMSTNEYIKAASEYSLPERAVGAMWESFCVPEDELIETHRGYLPANRVAENDLVRTHTGEWKAVEKVHVRTAEYWDIMKIIRAGGHEIPLRATKNHLICTDKGDVKAGDLKRGDVLVYPLVKTDPTHNIDVTEVIPRELTEEEIDGIPMVRKKFSVKFFPRHLEKTQALMRLFGYYVARGGPIRDQGTDHGLRIGFKSDTAKLDAMNTATSMFVQVTKQKIDNYHYLKLRSPIFAMLVTSLFGSAGQKRIPEVVLNSEDVMLKAFIKGLVMNVSWHTFRQKKPDILFDISKILLRLKIAHRIVMRSSGGFDLDIDQEQLGLVLFGKPCEPNELMWFDDDGTCHMKITSSHGYRPSGYLYDFTVFEDHTYSTGLYTIHNSHLDTPIHTRFLHYRSPLEEYERIRVYGRDAAFWEHPMRDFVEPWTSTLASSDSLSEGATRGGFFGALLRGPSGLVMGSLAGSVYGGGRDVLGMQSGVPGPVESKRELESYFDKLEYIKATRLYNLTGNPDFQRKAGETLAGLNPLGMSTEGWTSMYRSLPYAERPFFNAFMRTQDPDERQRIMDLAPDDIGNLLQVRWGIEDGTRDHRALHDFRESQNVSKFIGEEGIPEVGWGGWAPGVRMDDIKLKSAEYEGFDAHDFGLGWKDQMRRMEASPFVPGPVQMTELTHYEDQFLTGESNMNRYEVQTAIQRIIREFGAFGDVMIDELPGGQSTSPTGGPPAVLEINVTRSRALTSTLFSPERQLNPIERALANA